MTVAITQQEWKQLLDAWRLENDQGNGYTINVWRENTQDFEPASHMDEIDGTDGSGCAILNRDFEGRILAQEDHSTRITLICDSNGPWGCDVTNMAKEILGI